MNRILQILWIMTLAACAGIEKDQAMEIELNGQAPAYVMVKTYQATDTLVLKSSARYAFENTDSQNYVSVNSPGVRRLVYLESGKKLEAVLSPSKMSNALKFRGDLQAENEVLGALIEVDQAYNKTLKEVLALDWDGFYAQHLEYIEQRKALLENDSLSPIFIALEKKRNQILVQTGAFLHYNYHPSFNPNPAEPTSECLALIESVDLNDAAQLQIPEFLELAQESIDYQLGNVPFQNQSEVTKASLSLTENIKNEKIKLAVQKSLLANHIEIAGIDNIVDNLSVFYANASEREAAGIRALADPWLAISRGNAAPMLRLQDAEGNEHALSELHGKAVYIDFWATWCKPCIAELPDLEALQFALRDKEVVFLSVSIDDNVAAWKSFLANQNLGGLQWHQGNDGAKIREDYLLSSIPRFMLLDAAGNIISANAPRPSENALVFIQSELSLDPAL